MTTIFDMVVTSCVVFSLWIKFVLHFRGLRSSAVRERILREIMERVRSAEVNLDAVLWWLVVNVFSLFSFRELSALFCLSETSQTFDCQVWSDQFAKGLGSSFQRDYATRK